MSRATLGLAVGLMCAIFGCGGTDTAVRPAGKAGAAATGSDTSGTRSGIATEGSSGGTLARRPGRLRGDEDDDDMPGDHGESVGDYDADFDNDSKSRQSRSYHDGDDRLVTAWGHPASPADFHAVMALVESFYAAGAAGDAKWACSLLFSLFAEAVPEVYGGPAGPGYLQGETCAAVMSKLLRVDHSKFAATVAVTGLRVRGNQGRALIGSESLPASYLTVRRERGVWKVDELESDRLP